MMYNIAVVVLVLLSGVTAATDTCKTCKTTLGTGLTSGDAAAKCTALSNYIKCLDSTDKGSENCPLSDEDAKMITDFNDTAICAATPLTAVCKCQKNFWGAKGDCGAIAGLVTCTGNANGLGCNGTTSAAAILQSSKTRLSCSNLATTTEKSKGGRISDNNGLMGTLQMSMLGILFIYGF